MPTIFNFTVTKTNILLINRQRFTFVLFGITIDCGVVKKTLKGVRLRLAKGGPFLRINDILP